MSGALLQMIVFFLLIIYINFGCARSSLFCMTFSTCGEQGLLSVAVCSLLLLRSTGSRALGLQ